jgi:predicted esterase
MKKIVVFFLLLPFTSHAQSVEKGLTASNGEYIGFLEFRPSDYNKSNHPLIIFLHGIGEKGNGKSQLKNVNCCGIPSYIRGGNRMKFTWMGKTESFVVLSPQLSKKYSVWQPFYVDELIKYAKANLNIDPDRIFLTGLSLGGGGTWSFASSSQSRAEELAGIAPVVAPCMMTNGCNIARASLPVMAIHVWDDRDAPASCTVNAIKSINSCAPAVTPNVIMYGSGGHYVWVHRAFDTAHSFQNPNIYEWFLAQNRKFVANRKPITKAGKDVTITTGDGKTTLSGAASVDYDGTIERYIWTKISGPNKGSLSAANTVSLKISGLTTVGTYKYQLKTVDNRAEWSFDTVLVTVVKGAASTNSLPVASAGNDTVIQLHAAYELDGSSSVDGDGNISSYNWTKASGPDAFKISDPQKPKTILSDLVQGVYTFRLTVVDDRNGKASDIVQITVEADPDTLPPDPPDEGQQVLLPPARNYPPATLFPNPARSSTILRVTTSELGNSLVRIYDNSGRLVKTVSFVKLLLAQQYTIYTYDLPRGLYYLDISIGRGKRYHVKMLKQ